MRHKNPQDREVELNSKGFCLKIRNVPYYLYIHYQWFKILLCCINEDIVNTNKKRLQVKTNIKDIDYCDYITSLLLWIYLLVARRNMLESRARRNK